MASVNYLGRLQQVEIRTQATNKTTAQLLYVHRRVGETIKQRTTTSISDASVLSCYGWLFPPCPQRAPSAFHF